MTVVQLILIQTAISLVAGSIPYKYSVFKFSVPYGLQFFIQQLTTIMLMVFTIPKKIKFCFKNLRFKIVIIFFLMYHKATKNHEYIMFINVSGQSCFQGKSICNQQPGKKHLLSVSKEAFFIFILTCNKVVLF